MKTTTLVAFAAVIGGAALWLTPLSALEPLASRIVHTDPAKYRPATSVHAGAGKMAFTALLDYHSLDTNLLFLHRGVIDPHSGIGHHFHNNCEEMFVILDGEAQFTIDGRTSVLKGPAGAPALTGPLPRHLQRHRQAGAVDEYQRFPPQGAVRQLRPG